MYDSTTHEQSFSGSSNVLEVSKSIAVDHTQDQQEVKRSTLAGSGMDVEISQQIIQKSERPMEESSETNV